MRGVGIYVFLNANVAFLCRFLPISYVEFLKTTSHAGVACLYHLISCRLCRMSLGPVTPLNFL